MRFPVVASLAVVVAACGSTEPHGDVRVLAAVDRTSVPGSDSVRVSLSVTNVSGRTLEIVSPESYGFCEHAFRVLDDSDREVSIPTGLCIAATNASLVGPRYMDMPPGATVTVTDYWKPGDSTLDGYVIPPGEYRVQGLYHVEGKTVYSATMKVTVEFPAP
jgi:hypothetical protein